MRSVVFCLALQLLPLALNFFVCRFSVIVPRQPVCSDGRLQCLSSIDYLFVIILHDSPLLRILGHAPSAFATFSISRHSIGSWFSSGSADSSPQVQVVPCLNSTSGIGCSGVVRSKWDFCCSNAFLSRLRAEKKPPGRVPRERQRAKPRSSVRHTSSNAQSISACHAGSRSRASGKLADCDSGTSSGSFLTQVGQTKLTVRIIASGCLLSDSMICWQS